MDLFTLEVSQRSGETVDLGEGKPLILNSRRMMSAGLSALSPRQHILNKPRIPSFFGARIGTPDPCEQLSINETFGSLGLPREYCATNKHSDFNASLNSFHAQSLESRERPAMGMLAQLLI